LHPLQIARHEVLLVPHLNKPIKEVATAVIFGLVVSFFLNFLQNLSGLISIQNPHDLQKVPNHKESASRFELLSRKLKLP